jgi:hypothetical protein
MLHIFRWGTLVSIIFFYSPVLIHALTLVFSKLSGTWMVSRLLTSASGPVLTTWPALSLVVIFSVEHWNLGTISYLYMRLGQQPRKISSLFQSCICSGIDCTAIRWWNNQILNC